MGKDKPLKRHKDTDVDIRSKPPQEDDKVTCAFYILEMPKTHQRTIPNNEKINNIKEKPPDPSKCKYGPKGEPHETNMKLPSPETPCHVFTNLSRAHTSGELKRNSRNKLTNMRSLQWPDKDI